MADEKKTPKIAPKTITVDGLKLTIDPNVFDDWDVAQEMYEIEHPDKKGSDALAIVPFIHRIYGNQYQAVIDHLRRNGRVSLTAMGDFLTKVMQRAVPNSTR